MIQKYFRIAKKFPDSSATMLPGFFSLCTGEHINLSGHSLANMIFTILEIERSKDPLTEKKEKNIRSECLIHTTKELIRAQEAPNSRLN